MVSSRVRLRCKAFSGRMGLDPSVRSFGVLDARRLLACLRIRRTAKGGATNPEFSFSLRGT